MSDRIKGIIDAVSDLAMDYSSRMARAKDQGFDTDTPLYRGSSVNETEARLSDGHEHYVEGISTTPDAQYAANYGQNVQELYGPKGEYIDYFDLSDQMDARLGATWTEAQAKEYAKSQGYVGSRLPAIGGYDFAPDYRVFDENRLRSIDAAFNPSKKDSSNLLASGAGLGILGAGMFGSGQAKADVGSITPEEPGYRDRFEQGLGELFGGDREDHRRARNFTGILDFIPGVGDIAGAADTIDSYREDDYLGTGINGLATLLGAAPIVGPGLAKAVKNSKPSVKSALDQVDGILDGFTARQQPRQIETNFSTENVTDKKYLEPILDDLEVDAQRIQYDKPEIYLPDYYGKNAVVTMVDRSPTNTQIFGVNGVEFKTPQQIGGGRDYMFDEANSPGVVFANEEGATTSILNRKDQLGDDDMLILPMEMAHTSVDFPDFAPGLHTRYAQVAMSNKDKKYVNKLVNSGGGGYLIKSVDKTPVPDFDIDMEDLDTFLSGLTGPQRKTINNVFDMVNKPSPGQTKQGVKRIEGALSNTEMRAAVSDPEMFNQPSLMQTNNVGVITGGKAPSNHNTYNMGMKGLGRGVLNIPREAPPTAQDFLPDLFQLSRPGYIDSKDAYTARMGVRTAEINDGLLRRLGY